MSDWKMGIVFDCVPGETAEEKFTNAAKAGFAGVEVPTLNDEETRKHYKKLSDDSGVDIHSVMNIAHWRTPLSSPDPAVRQTSVDGVMASIATAVATGAESVLLVPAVVNKDICYEDAWSRSFNEIKRIVPEAEKNNILIGIENVWNKFLLSPIEFKKYVGDFDSKYIVSYFDVGNIVRHGFPQQWIRTLGSTLKKVHIKGFHEPKQSFVGLLDGTIDWKAVTDALKEVGYTGYITAELGPEGGSFEGLKKIRDDMTAIFSA